MCNAFGLLWSASMVLGTVLGPLLDFFKTGLGRALAIALANFGGAATGDWSAVCLVTVGGAADAYYHESYDAHLSCGGDIKKVK